MDKLSTEVLVDIFSFLDPKGVQSFTLVCREFYHISKSVAARRRLLTRYLPPGHDESLGALISQFPRLIDVEMCKFLIQNGKKITEDTLMDVHSAPYMSHADKEPIIHCIIVYGHAHCNASMYFEQIDQEEYDCKYLEEHCPWGEDSWYTWYFSQVLPRVISA
ncbi:hypothetical protein BC938DRAFT_484192 [Jimgerdemannia flammicorona]|uniref:F-box domain-containing protein n=1 Tax=Jimgerdemannia flammicorona TaxID=994334 RepID=A0A433QAC2_9FUNG|nr:hypothetical protein BC938DRAFT_484192 [Jimgerdemannia flammicorona]